MKQGQGPASYLFGEKSEKEREKAAACEAFDRMVATRPLQPPTRKLSPGPVRTAGALAAARDRRLGVLDVGER